MTGGVGFTVVEGIGVVVTPIGRSFFVVIDLETTVGSIVVKGQDSLLHFRLLFSHVHHSQSLTNLVFPG